MTKRRRIASFSIIALVAAIAAWWLEAQGHEPVPAMLLAAPSVAAAEPAMAPAAAPVAADRILEELPTMNSTPRPPTVPVAIEPPALCVVVHDERGVPVAGMRATLDLLGAPPSRWQGMTNERGEWSVASTGPGPATVSLASGERRDIDLVVGCAQCVQFVVADLREVRGRVLDPAGHGIAGATVCVAPHATVAQNVWAAAAAESDADGRFVLRHVASGARIGARARGFVASPLVAPVGRAAWPQPLELVLARGGTRIEGRVVDGAGAAVPDASIVIANSRVVRPDVSGAMTGVAWEQQRCSTASDGTFAVDGQPSGNVRLVAWSARHARSVVDLVLTAGETVVVPVQLTAGARLRGTVVGSDGRAIAGARLMLGSGTPRDAMLPSTRSRADGTFALHGAPAGELMLRVRAHGFIDNNERWSLRDGIEHPLRIVLDPAPILTGTVTDAGGAPARVWIEAREAGTRRPLSERVEVGADGSFELPCQGSDPVQLWVRRPGNTVEQLLLDVTRAPANGLVLRLSDSAAAIPRVGGELRDEHGPVANFALHVQTADGRRRVLGHSDLDSGAFAASLPPGSYRLLAGSGPDERCLTTFALRAGERLDLGVVRVPDGARSTQR